MSNTATTLGLRSGLFDRNLSVLAIPATFAVAFLPHTVKVILLGDRFDNEKPRAQTNFKVTDDSIYREKINRLAAIHTNGMENFPLFAAAVLAANFARLPTRLLNTFSLSYLASRILFSFIYYSQSSTSASVARSVSYFGGMLGSLWVLVKSGNRLNQLL
ncbi:hypothetical protein FFLO_01070 [Filobasidium floriforme]|uniref:Uncharacterized protein n=1 Tax=Filobasidium floriforme TaxID=5210 RepID=A0A8K0JQN4_9TREE|nr:hypothetical protein FFLO_01070 [Filobasidium floriforme]